MAVIKYIRKKYATEPEFLWKKFPRYAIWRYEKNNKWYGVIMSIPRTKLGMSGDDMIEIMNLRMDTDEIPLAIDNKHYFPGWHMNKNHWITIILDGSVATSEIYRRIDNSYQITINK